MPAPSRRQGDFSSSQAPQLSERDSIFATHYLPSDDPQSPQRRLASRNGTSHPQDKSSGGAVGLSKVKSFPVRHDVSALSAAVNAANAGDDALDGSGGECLSPMTTNNAAASPSDVMPPPPPPPLPEASRRKRDNTRSSTQETRRSERSASKSRPRVEKSIEASLAEADPSLNVRSRKSSHFLGLFKENTAKKREDDDMVRSPKKKKADEQPGAPKLALPHRPRLPHTATTPVVTEDGPEQAEKSKHIDIPRTRKPLPPGLLDEIRNYHETVSGKPGRNGSPPLSRSVPTPFRDRSTQLYRFENAFQTPSPESGSDRTHRETPERSDEEEDNDKEHISAALYFPHKRTVEDGSEGDRKDQIQQHDGSGEDERRWTATPGPEAADSVDISLRSMGDNRILHEGLRGSKIALNETQEPSVIPPPESTYESLSEAESVSVSEYGSVSGKEDESSSHTDDAGTTPTATSHVQKHAQPQVPLGAVELKPYRHQVGGHTTVFRFSRRAVCKQLNNRENVFYERIERRHPEMLMFLPR